MAGVAAELERSGVVSASRWSHGVIAAVIVASLVIQLVLLFSGGADANSGESGDSTGIAARLGRFFSFFTIQSNLIVLATAIVLALRPDHDGRAWRVARAWCLPWSWPLTLTSPGPR